jgi:hypothetical protein
MIFRQVGQTDILVQERGGAAARDMAGRLAIEFYRVVIARNAALHHYFSGTYQASSFSKMKRPTKSACGI